MAMGYIHGVLSFYTFLISLVLITYLMPLCRVKHCDSQLTSVCGWMGQHMNKVHTMAMFLNHHPRLLSGTEMHLKNDFCKVMGEVGLIPLCSVPPEGS